MEFLRAHCLRSALLETRPKFLYHLIVWKISQSWRFRSLEGFANPANPVGNRRCLLIEPFPESALNEEAGRLLMEDYEAYAQHARLMTSIHAQSAKRCVRVCVIAMCARIQRLVLLCSWSTLLATNLLVSVCVA